jgi:hypothetical protein
VKFSLDDLWDGRLIYWIFANAMAGRPTLPYRLQDQFAKTHASVGFNEALVTDENDVLISPSEGGEDKELLVNKCTIYPTKNELFTAIFKDNNALEALNYAPPEKTTYEQVFRSVLKWRFSTVEEKLLQTETKVQLTASELKRVNRQRQNLSRW